MKELQAKAKVTQTMTRDGLVMENQATGTVENVSSREAEQDYSTDVEGIYFVQYYYIQLPLQL